MSKEEQELFDFMLQSHSEQEWNDNCDTIKRKFNGYPDYWYSTCIVSGLLGSLQIEWKQK